jgi:hypothetical chaperone protein
MHPVCGIDFGTSNSTVGVVTGARVVMAPVEGAHTTIPSAIFYPSDGGAADYGRAAMEHYMGREPGRLMRSLKSILGSSLMDEKTGVGGRYLTFEEILVGFVRHLKQQAERAAGATLTKVVMGRPVHFVDDDEAVDARAQAKLGTIAEKAGFKSVEFQYEPIAAALEFENGLASDELVFIADIGGGTSDFSLVRVGPQRRAKPRRDDDILATSGTQVGGTHLDTRLSMRTVMPLLGAGTRTKAGRDLPAWVFLDLATWHRIHAIAEPRNLTSLRQILQELPDRTVLDRYMKVVREQLGHLVAKRVEDAKIALSTADRALVDLGVVEAGLAAEARRDVFDTAIGRELEKIHHAVDRAVSDAGVGADAVTAVFLTGGTSAVPAVKAVLTRRFRKARVVEGDRFASVGYGLALDAQRRFGATAAAGSAKRRDA